MIVRSIDLNHTFTYVGRKNAKMIKERLSISFQSLEWYVWNLGDFVKLAILA